MTFDLTQQTALAGFQANSWQPLRMWSRKIVNSETEYMYYVLTVQCALVTWCRYGCPTLQHVSLVSNWVNYWPLPIRACCCLKPALLLQRTTENKEDGGREEPKFSGLMYQQWTGSKWWAVSSTIVQSPVHFMGLWFSFVAHKIRNWNNINQSKITVTHVRMSILFHLHNIKIFSQKVCKRLRNSLLASNTVSKLQ